MDGYCEFVIVAIGGGGEVTIGFNLPRYICRCAGFWSWDIFGVGLNFS